MAVVNYEKYERDTSMNYRKQFIVPPNSKVDLRAIDSGFTGTFNHKADAKDALAHNLKRIGELQEMLYAEHKQSLLIVLQAMDAGGKDGTVKVVAGAMNPQGVRVTSFKEPTKQERDHDFLWRIHKETPGKGDVAVFNRSHYEDVLVVRVHDLVPKTVWKKRYGLINEFENALTENGTHVLKFFLHIDKQEQLKRFWERLHDPAKNWKISEADYSEREKWDDYQKAYEDVLSKCSTEKAPWFVIPSNHKWFRNLAISQIIVDTLEDLRLSLPEPTVDIKEIREKYFKAEDCHDNKPG
jgi:PPK2 family polyphosphate:nucleotide phosphotransferase